MADGRFGKANGGQEPGAIDEELMDRSIGPVPDDFGWWVTLVCYTEATLPDDEWSTRPYLWLDWQSAEKLGAEASETAGRALDHIAAIVASQLPNVMDQGPVLNGVVFRATGRRPFILPRIGTGSARVAVGSPTTFDATALSPLLHAARRSHASLESSMYWWARALEETDERKRFQSHFLVLEGLANKLAPSAWAALRPKMMTAGGEATDAPSAVIVPLKELRIAARFRLMAAYLDPAAAEDDVSTFMRLKRTRDAIAHGEWPLQRQVPHRLARSLADKYVRLALAIQP